MPAPGRCATGRTRAPPFAPPGFWPVWPCPCGLRTPRLMATLCLLTEGGPLGLDGGVVYDSPSERFSGVLGLDMGVWLLSPRVTVQRKFHERTCINIQYESSARRRVSSRILLKGENSEKNPVATVGSLSGRSAYPRELLLNLFQYVPG